MMLWDSLSDEHKKRLGFASYIAWNHHGVVDQNAIDYWEGITGSLSQSQWADALESVFLELDKIAQGE